MTRLRPPRKPGRPKPEMHAEPVSDWTVRHPWPDEVERTLALLDTPTFSQSPWVWICATGAPERLVGSVALDPAVPPAPGSRLHISVRPRFRDTAAATALVEAALGKARQEGTLPVTAQVPSAHGPQPRLEQAGFALVRTESLWEVRLEKLRARIEPVAASGELRLCRLGPVTIGPPRPEDGSGILGLLEEQGLWGGGELVFRPESNVAAPESTPTPPVSGPPPPAEVFDRSLSVVACIDGAVAAVILVRRVGSRRVIVSYRAVAPRLRSRSGTLNMVLLRQAVTVLADAGARVMVFVSRGGARDDTTRLAARCGGKCLRSIDVYRVGGE